MSQSGQDISEHTLLFAIILLLLRKYNVHCCVFPISWLISETLTFKIKGVSMEYWVRHVQACSTHTGRIHWSAKLTSYKQGWRDDANSSLWNIAFRLICFRYQYKTFTTAGRDAKSSIAPRNQSALNESIGKYHKSYSCLLGMLKYK